MDVRRWRSEIGASAIEYAILATAIAVAVVIAVAVLGRNVQDSFECTEDVVNDPLYECPQ
ncbi:MAG TPA: Flp family type IVb pilin [Nitriliruptorales bacterium]